jgi:hypothetical protein
MTPFLARKSTRFFIANELVGFNWEINYIPTWELNAQLGNLPLGQALIFII